MYASIVEEIKKKEKFIVLSPDIQASELLKKILFIIHENQREIDLQIGFSEHPAYYITVDRIFDLLASISEATGHEKLKKNINKALLEFIEKREEDKYNWGYIYPVLHLENALIKANICLISPQNDVRIPIAPIRKNCFEYSKNILDIILKGSVKNNKYDYNIHPVEKIYNEEIKKIIPYGLSIEHEINSLINSAFKPFSFIPIQDYIEDVIEYGNDKGYLIEITNDYHFRKSDILLDEYGNYIQSPPLYWHFFTILKGMESFVLDELNFLARREDFERTKNSIEDYQKIFYKIYDDDPKKELERFYSLIEIIDEIPISNSIQAYQRKNLISCKKAIKILYSLIDKFEDQEKIRKEIYFKNFLNRTSEKVINYCREKKQLYILEVDSIFKSTILELENYKEKLDDILENYIFSKFGNLESKSATGGKIIYLAPPGFISQIVHNLSILSFSNESFKRQLEISKIIRSRLEIFGNPELDIEIDEEEKARIKKEADVLKRRNKLKYKRENFKNSYNFKIGFLSAFFAFIYFIALYIFFKQKVLLYILLPISLGTGYLLSRVFSKRGLNPPKEYSSDTDNLQELDEVSNLIINFLINEKSETKERIYTPETLKNKIYITIKKIKNFPIPVEMLLEENTFSNLFHNYILKGFAKIHIPKEFELKNYTKVILVLKEDLKLPQSREKISEYYHSKISNLSNNKESEKEFLYYNYIYNSVNKDYFKYTM